MKRFMLSSILASGCLAVSAAAFATPSPEEQPLVLNAVQMDEVTAGASSGFLGFLQLNVAPVVITQIRVLNFEIDVNWTGFIQSAIRGAR